jgi:protease I
MGVDHNARLTGVKPMPNKLQGKRIAILATDGFEQAELMKPLTELREAGATVDVIAPSEGPAKTQKPGEIKGWDKTDWGRTVKVDRDLKDARVEDYDGLVLPGGVMNPDKLRQCKVAVGFVKGFYDAEKPIGAICHGPWTLIEAGVLKDRTVTSWPSLKTDITNAGAEWVDKEVCVDEKLITSRKPDDLSAFDSELIEVFGETPQLARAS